MTPALSCLVAFVVGVVYDLLNVRFIAAAERKLALPAALYSTLLGACAIFGFIEAVRQPRAIPFLLAGYFVGTYFAVRFTR